MTLLAELEEWASAVFVSFTVLLSKIIINTDTYSYCGVVLIELPLVAAGRVWVSGRTCEPVLPAD